MFDIGPEKILVVLFIALVFLGPERLPGMARQIGSAMREIRGVRDTVEHEIRGAFDNTDSAVSSAPSPADAAPSPRPELPATLPESRTFE